MKNPRRSSAHDRGLPGVGRTGKERLGDDRRGAADPPDESCRTVLTSLAFEADSYDTGAEEFPTILPGSGAGAPRNAWSLMVLRAAAAGKFHGRPRQDSRDARGLRVHAAPDEEWTKNKSQ